MLKVGDYVAFLRKDVRITDSACLAHGVDFINGLFYSNQKFYKWRITKVKTKSWFFRRHEPIYVIDDYYVGTEVKLIHKVKNGEILC